MNRSALAALALLAALVVAGSGPPLARAEFGPIELISKSSKEQAGRGAAPAISADGRYVAFAAVLGGRNGVFRKDLQTGEVVFVAPGRPFAQTLEPSISSDGRYIAFATDVPLLPAAEAEPGSRQVYVADMASSPPTYELVSAADGSIAALPGGSKAAGRVAISGDGRKVVFTNKSQVYVRDLEAETTTLITVRRDEATGAPTSEPAAGGGALETPGGAAAISADGSTVAWVGRHLPEQVPMLDAEVSRIHAVEGSAEDAPLESLYLEPLWRRVPTTAEPDPVTRRVVGGGDPLAPGCRPGGAPEDPACQGPYPYAFKGREFEIAGSGWGTEVPQLSADGNTVAVLGNPDEDNDLFMVDMRPGLSRDEAVRQLTHWINPSPDAISGNEIFSETDKQPYLGPIQSFSLAPDGGAIAFATTRQVFAPSPPSLITAPPPAASLMAELYQLDLGSETIERATPGGGQAASHGGTGASSPSLSGNGRLLAFASGSTNLVAGDTNEDVDAFVVASTPPGPIEPSAISDRPAALVVQPLWRLSAEAASMPNGTVQIILGVPGAGTAHVQASAPLGPRLRLRRLAAADGSAEAAGSLRLQLRLPRRLRHFARTRSGFYANVQVGFTGPSGGPLHAELEARFRVHRKRAKRK